MCPGCRRLLRIPAAGEDLPPLVAPLKESAEEECELDASEPQMKTRRRKKINLPGGDQAWDEKSEPNTASEAEESRQMFWMLIGGATLFLLMVGVVVVAMFEGDEAGSRQLAESVLAIATESETAEAVASAEAEKADAALLAAAKLLAGKFLEARRIEEMLPLVRNPDVAEARMRSHYAGGEIEAPGLMEFNTAGGFYRIGSSFKGLVRTRNYQDRSMAFFNTPEGMKIDWESWVGWSEMPWQEFIASKPTTGKLFRVLLNPVTYYNFSFSDERKWKAYRLESADGKLEVYGYVERGSELDFQINPQRGTKHAALTLSLKFPADAKTDNQVMIEKCIANGWFLEPAKTP